MRKRVAVAAAELLSSAPWSAAGSPWPAGSSRARAAARTTRRQQADRATAAALDATGGGTANSVERDSENGATWEVEVTKTDGRTVDVRLDENYAVVVIEGDTEDAGEPGRRTTTAARRHPRRPSPA